MDQRLWGFKTGSWIYPNLHEEKKGVGRVFECTLMFAVACCCAKFLNLKFFRATSIFSTENFNGENFRDEAERIDERFWKGESVLFSLVWFLELWLKRTTRERCNCRFPSK